MQIRSWIKRRSLASLRKRCAGGPIFFVCTFRFKVAASRFCWRFRRLAAMAAFNTRRHWTFTAIITIVDVILVALTIYLDKARARVHVHV